LLVKFTINQEYRFWRKDDSDTITDLNMKYSKMIRIGQTTIHVKTA
jgi:hypothetical protein